MGGVGHIPDPNDGSVKPVLLEEPVEPRNTIRPAVSITVEDDEIGRGKIDSRP
jgi:hypothetical protein